MIIEKRFFYWNASRRARMQRVPLLLVAAFFCNFISAGSVLARPREDPFGPKMRVTVMDLSGALARMQTGFVPNFASPDQAALPPTELARGLTEMLTTELVKTGKFVVLERAAIQQVTGEQDFAASERVNRETAAARSFITGAQALITGDITEFSLSRSNVSAGISFAGFGAKVSRVTAMVAMHIRVIDAVTGEVIFSERVKGTSTMKGVSSDVQQIATFAATSGKPLGNASQKAIERAVAAISAKLANMVWAGRIVEVRGKDVYVNAGSESGIYPGMEFEVYERQEALVDPDSGRVLGAPERRIGNLSIVSVEDKYSIARSMSAEVMKRNHVVRLSQQIARRISE